MGVALTLDDALCRLTKTMKKTDTTHKPNTVQSLEKAKTRTGTTIVETAVALALFAMFMTGACKLLLSHRGAADITREHYTAVNIAKNRVELARTFSFEALAEFGEDDTPVDAFGEPTSAAAGNYRRSTSVNMVTNNLMELTVTVDIRNHKTWGFDGANQEVVSFISFHH